VVTLRPLRRADFGMLARWLVEPLVARWWADEHTPQALERDYGPCIDGIEPCEVFVVEDGGVPVGLVQRYRLDAYPEDAAALAALLPLPAGALSIDYLVGEATVRRRGVGTAMVAEVVRRSWVELPAATAVVVPVAAGNRASWRTLERAGFTRVARDELVPDNPADPPDSVVLVCYRPVGRVVTR
jgi:aminoglycoside 6'-N-acetyltransferase